MPIAVITKGLKGRTLVVLPFVVTVMVIVAFSSVSLVGSIA